MATRSLGLCDICGFRYPLKTLKKNSYGMMVCPMDFEGQYDLKNHPQNRIADVSDNENIRDARPLRPALVSAVPVSAWLPSD
jgi:hypothetical protein|tara:strand:+ start:591 stop:836 length:246 start_codon:yes stop_codon:yes gene_type:complete